MLSMLRLLLMSHRLHPFLQRVQLPLVVAQFARLTSACREKRYWRHRSAVTSCLWATPVPVQAPAVEQVLVLVLVLQVALAPRPRRRPFPHLRLEGLLWRSRGHRYPG